MQGTCKSRLEKSFVNVGELLKEFNPKDFARSLLPRLSTHELVEFGEDEDETTYYGEFLDNLEENIKKNDELSDISVNSQIDDLRIWSRVAFRENKPDPAKDLHSGTKSARNVKSQNKGITSVDLTCKQILSHLKRDEVKTEEIIMNFLHEEIEVKSSNDEVNNMNHPLFLKASTSNVMRFFYLDAFENLFGDNKTVHLFGKIYRPQTNKYTSCCIAVGPLKRKLFVLPRSKLTGEDLNTELLFTQEEILDEFYCVAMKPLGITKFNFRFVLRTNLDNILGSNEIICMEIEYSSHYPPVDQDVIGASFYKVYGVKQNYFENFVLEKGIKGPCWLDISNPKEIKNQKTWCSLEISCTPGEVYLTNPNLNLQVPPLTILSMYIKTVEHIKEKSKEVALMSWATCKDYDMSRSDDLNSLKTFCVFATPEKGHPLPKIYDTFRRTIVKNMSSESDLLNYFLEEFNIIDPDMLVGYNFQNQEISNLVNRLVSLKIKDFSRLSRFRGNPKHTDVKAFLFSGRLICDMKMLAKDFIFSKNQELEALYEKFLNISNEQRYSNVRIDFFPDDKLLESVVFTTNEAIYLLKLVFNSYIIPLLFKLSKISGTSLSQTFAGGVSKRSEFMILHTLHEKGFILPDRVFKYKNDTREKELSGGLVLEPKIGFYDNFILLMDFRSLYPSIIQEYNLCLSHSDAKQKNPRPGVIPSLMKQLIEKRQKVKILMKGLDKKSISYSRYNVYQSALKLSSNGIYGCLSSQFFRFYCPAIVTEIVERAREILRNSTQILQNRGFEIIYGDTDSMMINTKSKDLAEVQKLGEQINSIINKKFSCIELRVDSVFQRLLIVGKKKYAGIAVQYDSQNFHELNYEIILKGLDVIRSDWPSYVCQMGRVAIDTILSDICFQDKVSKIKELLNQMKEDLMNHRVPKTLLLITKYLTQNPENYSSRNSFPYVEAALRTNQNSVFPLRKGDAISYIMCYNENANSQKGAFQLKELNRYPEWKVDALYYLEKQVYPMIWRICSCLDGMGQEIEDILGTKYASMKDGEEGRPPPRINKIKFDRRNPFTFLCTECGKSNGIALDITPNKNLALLTCQNPSCSFCPLKKPEYLRNQLVLAIRRYIKTYYKYESSCRNPACRYTGLRVPLNSSVVKENCPSCKKDVFRPIFGENDLFLQLKYFRSILNNEISLSSEQWSKDVYNDLLKTLDYYEKHSDFERVNLTQLFWNY